MYKTQMKLQKLACFFVLVVAVILFLYALGIMTDLYDTLYGTLRIRVLSQENAAGENYVVDAGDGYVFSVTERLKDSGTTVYVNMQPFNKVLVSYSIVFIILVALLFVTNTSTRRRFYVSNYVAIGVVTAASIYIPIFAHPYIEIFKAQFKQIDFAALKEYSETYGTRYTESTLWFDLHYVVMALMFLAALALVGMCVMKILVMRDERRLVDEGKKVKA